MMRLSASRYRAFEPSSVLLPPRRIGRTKELKELSLFDNQFTDLTPLAGLTNLRGLILLKTPKLTKAEIDKLQQALPKTTIIHKGKK